VDKLPAEMPNATARELGVFKFVRRNQRKKIITKNIVGSCDIDDLFGIKEIQDSLLV
jgi:hypothetical protein